MAFIDVVTGFDPATRPLRSRIGSVPLSPVRGLGWVAAVLIAAFALFVPSPGAAGAGPPAGDDGTVKIHEGATEIEPIVANDPHVCTFHLHFFFADPRQAGVWRIEAWPPTGAGETVLSGTYDTSATGEDRAPDTGTYALAIGHYKLFWQGDEEHLWKHKVFWVECGLPAVTPSPSPSPSPGVSPSPSASPSPGVSPSPSPSPSPSVSPSPSPSPSPSASPSPQVGVLPSAEVSPSPTGGVAGEVATPRASPPPTDTSLMGNRPDEPFRLTLLALAGFIAGLLVLLPAERPLKA
jgi:hypothetical protein